MDHRSLVLASKYLAEIDPDSLLTAESRKAERAQRLAELLQSDVWKLDLYPIMRHLHDVYLEAVKRKEMDADALKVFDDILNQLDGSIRIGAGAMERLAARRAKAATVSTKLNQQQDSSSAQF